MIYNMQPMPANQYYDNYPYSSKICMNPFACRMRVEGVGRLKVQPDLASIVIGAITENKQLKIAQEENARIIKQVLNTLNKMGVSSNDIQTEVYTINPQYDFIDGKQVLRGYSVEHTLNVIMRDMNRIGEVIDAAVQNGVNQVGRITFSLNDPSIYYRQALSAAVEDSLAKARTLGQKLRIAVSDVPVQIVEESYENDSPIQPYLMMEAETATQIQTGQIEITARINVVFTYSKI